jgi:multidrug resistance efflux pump
VRAGVRHVTVIALESPEEIPADPEEIAEAEAEAARARANYELLLAGTRSEEVAAAEARVAELQSRVRELEVNLREAVVRAPEKAVVEVLSVRKGDVVAPNQAVARVLRAEDLWVKVFVPETELGRLRLNQTVTVTVDSYPGKRFQGTVRQVAAISEFTPRNVQSVSERRHQVFAVKVCVADPQGVFKSGMSAEVQLPLHD